jgi:UbiD family decarboxylase
VRQGRALWRCGLIKKTAEGQPQQAIMAAFGTETYCKIVVVVDEDIGIFDLADVMWVVATRSRADRDLVFVHRAMGAILDPTSDPVDNTLTKSASTDQARRRRLRRASNDRRQAARLCPPHPYPPPNRR